MIRVQHRWWIFGGCAAAVVLAMAWITAMVLQLERGEGYARADAEHQSTLRLALWRMDSWLAPQLAREAARSYFEYGSVTIPITWLESCPCNSSSREPIWPAHCLRTFFHLDEDSGAMWMVTWYNFEPETIASTLPFVIAR